VVEHELFEGASNQEFKNSIIAGGNVEVYLKPGAIRLPSYPSLIATALFLCNVGATMRSGSKLVPEGSEELAMPSGLDTGARAAEAGDTG